MGRPASFEIYLRTGRRAAPVGPDEFKFNPWHDPRNGRFTFAGQGNYSGGGERSQNLNAGDRFPGAGGGFRSSDSQNQRTRAASDASSRASRNLGSQPSSDQPRFSPKNPRNYSVHVVQRGETLTSITAKRKGLRVSDLAWLNGISPDRPLRIGQRFKLPNQSYLDAGRNAKNKFVALSNYIDTHGGRLPPNAASPPSLELQVEAAGVRTVILNDYDFDVDVLDRSRRITGQLQLKEEQRSRREQRDAGKPDRRPHDDGGHYIAARFNGPRERFNHFAQDRKFNRGAYRTIEDQWANALRAGKKVYVDIVPLYEGISRRPYSLNVVWYVEGQRFSESFPNETKDK